MSFPVCLYFHFLSGPLPLRSQLEAWTSHTRRGIAVKKKQPVPSLEEATSSHTVPVHTDLVGEAALKPLKPFK